MPHRDWNKNIKCTLCNSKVFKKNGVFITRNRVRHWFCYDKICQEILNVASTYHQHITPAADLVYRRAFNACECCGEMTSSRHMVDHCHKTEIVRGTVCPSCNTKIGKHESVNFNVDYPDYIKDFAAKTVDQDYNPIYAAKMWYKHGDDWKEVDKLNKKSE
jgi:hypothetical protein|tara:strand:+ start:284 stop:766 length:483 start_codon:yes stop_codon:yes gene_type:complete